MGGKTAKRLTGLLLPAGVLLCWYLATTYTDVPKSILPSLPSVGGAFLELSRSGKLQADLLVSLGRVFKGFLLSAVLGVGLGGLMGISAAVRALLQPTLTALRQIPMIAWTPLVILWCGIGEKSKVVVIVLAATFPILMSTLSGIENAPGEYLELARLYRLGRWQTFRRIYWPACLPQVFTGLRTGLSISWMALIAAELMAGTSGIGFRMSFAKSLIHSDEVMVCMIVIGLVGMLLDRLVALLLRRAMPWREEGRL